EHDRLQIMSPVPRDDEVIGRDQTAQADWNLRNAEREQRTDDATDCRSNDANKSALPEKNRAHIAAAITHRLQDRDLFQFRKHGHGEHIENSESGEEQD